MKLIINIKPFSFQLTRKLITSQGTIHKKVGLLLQIKDSEGNCGWGEVSPIEKNELKKSIESLDFIGRKTTKDSLENYLCELLSADVTNFSFFCISINYSLNQLMPDYIC